jgi:hypothetical protein
MNEFPRQLRSLINVYCAILAVRMDGFVTKETTPPPPPRFLGVIQPCSETTCLYMHAIHKWQYSIFYSKLVIDCKTVIFAVRCQLWVSCFVLHIYLGVSVHVPSCS